MKRMKTIASLLALVLVVSVMAVPVAAAGADDEDTTATVTFEIDTSGPGGATLYFKTAPSFDFGIHTISPGDETYTATAASDRLLSVVDARATGTGWNVTAEITGSFTSQTTGTDLAGSRILITGGTVSYGANAQTPPPAPSPSGNIVLNNSGGPAKILNAAAGQGKGIWNDTFGQVELEVLGSSALAEAYVATVTWTLSDVPA